MASYEECSLALERTIKKTIFSSDLPHIFLFEFGPDVRTFRVEIAVFLKIDDVFVKHKEPFFIVIECGSLLMPIHAFYDVDKNIIAFKYQYKTTTSKSVLSKFDMVQISFDYALCIMKHNSQLCPHRINPSKFVNNSFE